MSGISISLHGDAVVRAALERAPVRLAWHVDRALNRASQEIARQMRRDAPKDTSVLTNSVTASQTALMEYRVGPGVQYAAYVEDGTGPGGWPAPEALARWIKRKRIRPRTPGTSERDLTYLIGRAIHRRGTREQPFVRPIAASPFFRQRVRQLVDDAVAATVREIVR